MDIEIAQRGKTVAELRGRHGLYDGLALITEPEDVKRFKAVLFDDRTIVDRFNAFIVRPKEDGRYEIFGFGGSLSFDTPYKIASSDVVYKIGVGGWLSKEAYDLLSNLYYIVYYDRMD